MGHMLRDLFAAVTDIVSTAVSTAWKVGLNKGHMLRDLFAAVTYIVSTACKVG